MKCRECGGLGWVVVDQTIGWPYGEQVQCSACHVPVSKHSPEAQAAYNRAAVKIQEIKNGN